MVVIICDKYEKNHPNSRHYEMHGHNKMCNILEVAKSWLKDLANIGHGQKSLHMRHTLMLVIICAIYEANPSSTAAKKL